MVIKLIQFKKDKEKKDRISACSLTGNGLYFQLNPSSHLNVSK